MFHFGRGVTRGHAAAPCKEGRYAPPLCSQKKERAGGAQRPQLGSREGRPQEKAGPLRAELKFLGSRARPPGPQELELWLNTLGVTIKQLINSLIQRNYLKNNGMLD